MTRVESRGGGGGRREVFLVLKAFSKIPNQETSTRYCQSMIAGLIRQGVKNGL